MLGRFRQAALLALVAVVSSCRTIELDELRRPAPFAARNQHPAQLTGIHPLPRAARPVAPGSVEGRVVTDWSNILVKPGPGTDRVDFDGETLRVAGHLRTGITPDLDIDVELPFVIAGGGVLDSFIQEFHDLFWLNNDKRRSQLRGQAMLIAKRDPGTGSYVTAWEMKPDGPELGDIPITMTWFPWRNESFSVGIRGGIELPTGDQDKGYGSGGFDYHAGLVTQWDGPGVSTFLWGGWSWVATPDVSRAVGLEFADMRHIGGAAEFALTPAISAIVQLEWERSVLRRLDDLNASGDQVMIWTGLRARLGEDADLDFAVGEDLMRDISPDVIFHFGLRVGL